MFSRYDSDVASFFVVKTWVCQFLDGLIAGQQLPTGQIQHNAIDTVVGNLCLVQYETLWVATRAHYFHSAN